MRTLKLLLLLLFFPPQVEELKKELETQNREKVTLETRVNKAEKKIHNLNTKLVDVSSVVV